MKNLTAYSMEQLQRMERAAFSKYCKLATTPCVNPSPKDLEPLAKATAKWEAIGDEIRRRLNIV